MLTHILGAKVNKCRVSNYTELVRGRNNRLIDNVCVFLSAPIGELMRQQVRQYFTYIGHPCGLYK